MEFPAQLMEELFEGGGIELQALRQREKREVIGFARECLDFSASGAEMPAAGSGFAAPADCARAGSGFGLWLGGVHIIAAKKLTSAAKAAVLPGLYGTAKEPVSHL